MRACVRACRDGAPNVHACMRTCMQGWYTLCACRDGMPRMHACMEHLRLLRCCQHRKPSYPALTSHHAPGPLPLPPCAPAGRLCTYAGGLQWTLPAHAHGIPATGNLWHCSREQQVHTHPCTHAHVPMYKHMHTYMHAYAHIHARTRTCRHVHTHACALPAPKALCPPLPHPRLRLAVRSPPLWKAPRGRGRHTTSAHALAALCLRHQPTCACPAWGSCPPVPVPVPGALARLRLCLGL